jgi:hypothetical protein
MPTSGNSLQLDLSGFAKGMYAVRITDQGRTTIKSIIIQ